MKKNVAKLNDIMNDINKPKMELIHQLEKLESIGEVKKAEQLSKLIERLEKFQNKI